MKCKFTFSSCFLVQPHVNFSEPRQTPLLGLQMVSCFQICTLLIAFRDSGIARTRREMVTLNTTLTLGLSLQMSPLCHSELTYHICKQSSLSSMIHDCLYILNLSHLIFQMIGHFDGCNFFRRWDCFSFWWPINTCPWV